jgi:hypothetical protein
MICFISKKIMNNRAQILCALVILLGEKALSVYATCIPLNCTSNEQCSTCGIFTPGHFVFHDALYACVFKRPFHSVCELDPTYITSNAMKERVQECLMTNEKCCDPGEVSIIQKQQCEKKSCRPFVGCTLDGACQYDYSDPRKGRNRGCCNQDTDCPPYAAPHFWDPSGVSEGEKLCTVATCDRITHSCKYSRAANCCVEDSPDCDNLVYPSAMCSRGACVFNPFLAAQTKLSPFAHGGGFEELR